MKTSLRLSSLLLIFVTGSTIMPLQAMEIPDGNESQSSQRSKSGNHSKTDDDAQIFPQEFSRKPKVTEELIKKILVPGKIVAENTLYIRRMIEGNELWIYESKSLSKISQLENDPIFDLIPNNNLKKNAPVDYYRWDFKVTILGEIKNDKHQSPDERYTFSLFLFLRDKMDALSAENKRRIGDVMHAQREVKTSRLRSYTLNQNLATKGILNTMRRMKVKSSENKEELSNSGLVITPEEAKPKPKPVQRTLSSMSFRDVLKSEEEDEVVGGNKENRKFRRRADDWRKQIEQAKTNGSFINEDKKSLNSTGPSAKPDSKK